MKLVSQAFPNPPNKVETDIKKICNMVLEAIFEVFQNIPKVLTFLVY